MRRTRKDVKILYECYCRAWEHDNIKRIERLRNHGWIESIWIREYDGVIRMSPTVQGKDLVQSYLSAKNFDSVEDLISNTTE